jgi:hypothetical protein
LPCAFPPRRRERALALYWTVTNTERERMQNRQWIFAVIGGLSFVLMTGSLVLAYANAGEEGVGIAELGPSLALAFVFLVNVVLAKQNRRR